MKRNIIIKVITRMVRKDKIKYISGEIINVGTEKCAMTSKRGSVYGFAIKIENNDLKEKIFNSICDERKKIDNLCKWKSIAKTKYFPLYWGKDINMGARILAHTRSMKSTGTLQLNKLDVLKNCEIIYGAVPCLEYEKYEKQLKNDFPDLLKIINGEKDTLEIKDFVGNDE